ncbi:MAG: SMP-30/gluconolactonase/LRE family protein [Armatimonadetes bacterium]|nr:SMP-30/gluconolactonase/LRE family protein [Armatimonadota bacterium]
MKMPRSTRWMLLLLVAALPSMAGTRLLCALPGCVNTPDGMTLQPDGSIILSAPNFNNPAQPPLLIKVSPDNKPEVWYTLPSVEAGPLGRVGAMGICRAESGDIFLADMQYFTDKNQKSKLWRINVRDGKPTGMTLVAKGFNVANGLAIRGDSIYITESVMEEDSHPLTSAVLKFKLTDENITLTTPVKNDPHIIATFKSSLDTWRFGADGIAFDSKGNLFVGLFGEGEIHKLTFDAAGKVASQALFAKSPEMLNCDGMSCDRRSDILYVADSAGNAIRAIMPCGEVLTLAISPEAVGQKGKLAGRLDQPCEALVRGHTVVASNMDFPFPGMVNTKWDMPATLVVADIADLVLPARCPCSRAAGRSSLK